jgi:hypothetical protein
MSAADSCSRGLRVAYEIVASPCLICGFEAITVYGSGPSLTTVSGSLKSLTSAQNITDVTA